MQDRAGASPFSPSSGDSWADALSCPSLTSKALQDPAKILRGCFKCLPDVGTFAFRPFAWLPRPNARRTAIKMQNAQRTPKDKSPAKFGRRQASLCTGDCCCSEAVKANGSGLLILMVTSLSTSPIDFP